MNQFTSCQLTSVHHFAFILTADHIHMQPQHQQFTELESQAMAANNTYLNADIVGHRLAVHETGVESVNGCL